MAGDARIERDGATLRLAGALQRDAVAGLHAQAAARLAGVERVDLSAVTVLDSAGLALVSALVAGIDPPPVLVPPPAAAGLDELRAAYRLDDALAFA